MADRKPIRWAVPQGAEGYMGLATYYRDFEESMRQSFSQPSRSIRRTLPDGTTIDYVMNDVVDFIEIRPPAKRPPIVKRGEGMEWDILPVFKENSDYIEPSSFKFGYDFQLSPLEVKHYGYYCTVSVKNAEKLPVNFSVQPDSTGWSIESGIFTQDLSGYYGEYKIDGLSATLWLDIYPAFIEGGATVGANDGMSELNKNVSVEVVSQCSGYLYNKVGSNYNIIGNSVLDLEQYFSTGVIKECLYLALGDTPGITVGEYTLSSVYTDHWHFSFKRDGIEILSSDLYQIAGAQTGTWMGIDVPGYIPHGIAYLIRQVWTGGSNTPGGPIPCFWHNIVEIWGPDGIIVSFEGDITVSGTGFPYTVETIGDPCYTNTYGDGYVRLYEDGSFIFKDGILPVGTSLHNIDTKLSVFRNKNGVIYNYISNGDRMYELSDGKYIGEAQLVKVII
jgi:hypothetical protein